MYNPPNRKRIHFSFDKPVFDVLKRLCEAEHRTPSDEVSFLVMERARLLDLAGQVDKEGG